MKHGYTARHVTPAHLGKPSRRHTVSRILLIRKLPGGSTSPPEPPVGIPKTSTANSMYATARKRPRPSTVSHEASRFFSAPRRLRVSAVNGFPTRYQLHLRNESTDTSTAPPTISKQARINTLVGSANRRATSNNVDNSGAAYANTPNAMILPCFTP